MSKMTPKARANDGESSVSIKEWLVRKNEAEDAVRECAVNELRSLGMSRMDAARVATTMVDVFRLGVDAFPDSTSAPAQGGGES